MDNSTLRQQVPPLSKLEAIRDRILGNLNIGRNALAYKAAQKVLNEFIGELYRK
ncbi:MAG: hypothetical protein RIM23_19650 [Coleofasciculus sp. G3-WIS-01]|uniref:hypothetical protein n=1 Tax=Coleofasciculus sp. G3-WIS-01 TaxID=3069528 RepID=UPI0032F9B765